MKRIRTNAFRCSTSTPLQKKQAFLSTFSNHCISTFAFKFDGTSYIVTFTIGNNVTVDRNSRIRTSIRVSICKTILCLSVLILKVSARSEVPKVPPAGPMRPFTCSVVLVSDCVVAVAKESIPEDLVLRNFIAYDLLYFVI